VKPQIHSKKHIVQYPQDTIPMGTVRATELVKAEVGAGAVASEIEIGSLVKAIYIEVWVNGDGAQFGSQILIVEKTNQSSPSATFSDLANLYAYANRAQVLFTTEGLVGDSNSNPIPLIRQWIKIPKGKQRFAQGDRLILTVSSQADDLQICGMSIYKEYF